MNKKLYIGNLSDEVTEQDLNHNFSTVGKVVSVAIIKDRYSNRTKGFGFVEMETEEDARKAIEQFNGETFGVRSLPSAKPEKRRNGKAVPAEAVAPDQDFRETRAEGTESTNGSAAPQYQ